MDLIYKIYSVWLYQNQLEHDWLFFYNRKKDFMGNVNRDAPYSMFGSSDFCASTKIYNMDKTSPDFLEQSVRLMKAAAHKEGVKLISSKDIITLVPLEGGKVSYSGAMPSELVEVDGKYKGLKKIIYTPYNVFFNETKAGFNPHEFEVMGIWNEGSSQYSNYRIWQEKSERERAIRDYKINSIFL
jgi:hypothetical protein